MNGRLSLVEQKRLQWAREREEMARLSCTTWGTTTKPPEDSVQTAIRTRMSTLSEAAGLKRGCGSGLGCPKNLGRLAGQSHLLRASLVSLHSGVDGRLRNTDSQVLRRRSPSLPPIYTRDSAPTLQQQLQPKQLEGDEAGLRYQIPNQSRNSYLPRNHIRRNGYGSPRDELEGETSGYASDSAEIPLPALVGVDDHVVESSKPPGTAMSENGLQNSKNYNCYVTPESSLPPSRRLSATQGCAEVRPRWGSLWGQELVRGDPPPPSWLERGLSRIDHTSQVLVINHDSASSPDSSTTGSAGSDSNKTYLRGQNVPLDEGILQEREAKRQKALELQNAIKHQLEERDRQRKEEKQRRLIEDRAEEERIRRERDEEKRKFEEEQRRLKEKEEAKHKKEEAMRELLEAAERRAKEEKRFRRTRNDHTCTIESDEEIMGIDIAQLMPQQETASIQKSNSEITSARLPDRETLPLQNCEHYFTGHDAKDTDDSVKNEYGREGRAGDGNIQEQKYNTIQLPVSTEIAIVLSGRLQDPEILNSSNLQVNLVVTPSPAKFESLSNLIHVSETRLPTLVNQQAYTGTKEARLLTPSKYRTTFGREFGTQTDMEDLRENDYPYKEVSAKERKESLNVNRRDIEKSTSTGLTEELSMKTLQSRSKTQLRSSLEARPRWNANRPGTRYRTQSEKDPHYQRRLRLRRRQVDSSDDASRSPSPERRKPNHLKSKSRNATRRKIKLDSYDADLSMDSLNSIIPLRVDKNGRINIENNNNDKKNKLKLREINIEEKSVPIKEDNENLDTWCGKEILSQLTTLRNGLAMKQKEWDSERCLMSPSTDFY